MFLQVGLGIFFAADQDQPNLTLIAQLQLFCLSPMFSQSFFIEERKVKLSTFVCFLPNVHFQMRPRIGSLQVCIANAQVPILNCKALMGGCCMCLRPSVSVSLLCSECGAAACGGSVHGSQTGCRALVGALQSSSASSGQSVGDQLVPRQPFYPLPTTLKGELFKSWSSPLSWRRKGVRSRHMERS